MLSSSAAACTVSIMTTTTSLLLSFIAAINCLWPQLRPIKTGNYCDMPTSDTQIILSEELTGHNGKSYANIRK